MEPIISENTFETAIVQSLVESGGYSVGNAEDYRPELGMFRRDILQFLQAPQVKQWKS